MARRTDDLNSPTEAERLRDAQGLTPEERLRAEGSLLSEPERQDLADPTLSEADRRRLGDARATGTRPGYIEPVAEETDHMLGQDRVEAVPGPSTRVPDDGTIEIVEEQAVIGKQVRDTGGVRITTHTEIVPEIVRDTLTETAVEVDRVAVGRFVESVEAPRVEGDVTVVPVYEERLVVEKRLFLLEEVHLRRVTRSREVEVPVELRRQTAQVDRLPPLGDPTGMAVTHKEQPE